jgi:hypothetical protein
VTPRPPHLAERVVTWSLFPADREAVLGDLQEEFAAVADKSGADAAWCWYWTQTIGSIVPNILRRVRGAYELRRLAESDSGRQMRQSIRPFSVLLIITPIAGGAVLIWGGAEHLSTAFFVFGVVAESFGLTMLLASVLPPGLIDRETAAINMRRNSLFWLVLVVSGPLRLFFVPHQYHHLTVDTEFFLFTAILLWPKRYWPIRPRYLGPEIPQAPTPFVIGVGAEGPQFLTVDIPLGPANIGNLILARCARIVIDRVFAAREGLRVFAIVRGGTAATIDLLDAESHVVRTMNAPPERAAWSSNDARQLDLTVPLDQLAAGAYRLRVSVADAPDAGARDAAFRIRA